MTLALSLAIACSPSDSAVTLQGSGVAGLPASGVYYLLVDAEIMRANAVPGATIPVTRALQGTTIAAHATGATAAFSVANPQNITQTTLADDFTQPATGVPVTIHVDLATISAASGFLSIDGGGNYAVLSVIDPSHLSVAPTSATSNAVAGALVLSGAVVAVAGSPGPSGPGGGGGGSTVLGLPYASPAFGASATAAVASSAGAVPGNGCNVGTNSYIITAVPDSTHVTLLNGNVNNSVGTIASGATVVLSAGVLPTASAAPLDGQVGTVVSGAIVYKGNQPCINFASFGNKSQAAGVDNAPAFRAAALAAVAAGIPIYIPTNPLGDWKIASAIIWPGGVVVQGDTIATPISCNDASGKYWGGGHVGPNSVCVPPHPANGSFYTTAKGFSWMVFGPLQPMVCLNETIAGYLNNITGVTVELILEYTQPTAPGTFPILYSNGSKSHSSALTNAMGIILESGVFSSTPPWDVVFTLTTSVSGTVTTSTTGTPFPGSTPTGIVLDYDGAHMRGFVGNGSAKFSTAMSGTVVQGWWENFWLGASSSAGSWPLIPTDELSNSRVANFRKTKGSRYGAGTYTAKTSNWVASDCDTHTDLIFVFDPAYSDANAETILYGGIRSTEVLAAYPGNTAPANIGYLVRGILGPLEFGNGNQQFRNVRFKSFSDGLTAEACVGLYTNGCVFESQRGYTSVNNGYYPTMLSPYFITGGFVTDGCMSWGALFGAASGVCVIDAVNFQSTTALWAMVFSGVSAVELRHMVINAVNGLGAVYVNGASVTMVGGGCGDEGTGFGDCAVFLTGPATIAGGQFAKFEWIGGGISNEAGGSSTCGIRVDGMVDITVDCDIAIITAASIYQFIAKPRTPVQNISTTQGQALAAEAPYLLPTDTQSSLCIVPQAHSNRGLFTFPSDANYTPTGVACNQQLFGTVVIAPGPGLTSTRNLVINRNIGANTRWLNTTSQSVQVICATGTGITITAGSQAYTYDNGTNIVQG